MAVDAPWFEAAKARVGQKEFKGKANNPAIMQCFTDCGHDNEKEGLADATAWCAAGAGSCLVTTGYPVPPKAVNLMARSYLNYGTKLDGPKVGAIAVLKRGAPPHGHVGFVAEIGNGTIKLLGGNQSNSWSYADFKQSDVLSYRWPPEKMSTVSVVKTAVQSRRFMGALTSFIALVFGAILDGMKSLVDSIGWLIDGIPGMTGEASSLISSNEQIMGWLGIPWAKVSLGIAGSAMLYVAGRHIIEKVKGGAL